MDSRASWLAVVEVRIEAVEETDLEGMPLQGEVHLQKLPRTHKVVIAGYRRMAGLALEPGGVRMAEGKLPAVDWQQWAQETEH